MTVIQTTLLDSTSKQSSVLPVAQTSRTTTISLAGTTMATPSSASSFTDLLASAMTNAHSTASSTSTAKALPSSLTTRSTALLGKHCGKSVEGILEKGTAYCERALRHVDPEGWQADFASFLKTGALGQGPVHNNNPQPRRKKGTAQHNNLLQRGKRAGHRCGACGARTKEDVEGLNGVSGVLDL